MRVNWRASFYVEEALSVTKVFRSADYNSLLYVFQQLFSKVQSTKPQASRDVSAEIFVICTGYKAPKSDPRLFDPKWVFMEAKDEADEKRKTGASLADAVKYGTKRNRGGYEIGDDFRTITAIEFMKSTNAVDSVVSNHQIVFDDASEEIRKNRLTDKEVLECCKDLKVLGKIELGKLIKWRAKLKREYEKGRKTEKPSKEKGRKKPKTDSDSENEEDLKEIEEVMDKVSREERREMKKKREKKKKDEWRKKMSMGTDFGTGDEQDIFQGGDKMRKLLEKAEDVIPECSSDEDDGESDFDVEQPEAESDTERIAREEVEQILLFRERKERSKETVQKDLKKKKETRRQVKAKEWAAEMQQVGENIDAQAEDEHAKQVASSSDEEGDDVEEKPVAVEMDKPAHNWKDEEKAERWFAQGIFANVEKKEEEGESSEEDIAEMDDKDILKLPLTDKQRRQKLRKKNRSKNEKKKEREKTGDELEEEEEVVHKKEKLEIAPAFVPPEGALCMNLPTVQSSKALEPPTDPKEKAEIQALGSLMIRKKSRLEVIDAAYNRYVYDDIPDQLPEWFLEEENMFNKPELPITKELMDQFVAKMREINSRPIRKVAEAQARKKKRLGQRMDRLRKEAKVMADNPDMSAGAKARNMEKLVAKAKREDKRSVQTMAVKKGGGSNSVNKKGTKLGKNVKTKVVDRRLKSDKRGLKRADKKNKKKCSKKQNKGVKKVRAKKGSSRRQKK